MFPKRSAQMITACFVMSIHGVDLCEGMQAEVPDTSTSKQLIETASMSDDQLIDEAKVNFQDEFTASQSAHKYDQKVSERLRSLIRNREALSLSTEEVANLVRWAGRYKEPETTKLLIEMIEQPLKPILSLTDLYLIIACQSGLGNEGATLEGLEYLAKMTTEEYWLQREIQPQCPDNVPGKRSPTGVREQLRVGAHVYFYLSGTQYALDALSGGKAFPDDLLDPIALDKAIEYCEASLRGERPTFNVVPLLANQESR